MIASHPFLIPNKKKWGAIINYFLSWQPPSGVVIKEHNSYRLRSASLQKSVEEIRSDIDRIMQQMIKIAIEIDEKLGHYYR